MMRWLTFFCVLFLTQCKNINGAAGKIETYDQYRTQRTEPRDSLLVLYTVRKWGEKMFDTWAIRTDMYIMNINDVSYYISGSFYSADRKFCLFWVGRREPNAKTQIIYNKENSEVNKICPNEPDTIYSMSALIGFRDSINQIWKLYPFDQEAAECSSSKEWCINILGQYYFEKMKTSEMYCIMQSGDRKGHKESQAYGFNLQDKDFWAKCWLWKKDTVGSYDLYPFQLVGYACDIEGYNRMVQTYPDQKEDESNGEYLARHGKVVMKPLKSSLKECAEPYKIPVFDYPKEILDLYK